MIEVGQARRPIGRESLEWREEPEIPTAVGESLEAASEFVDVGGAYGPEHDPATVGERMGDAIGGEGEVERSHARTVVANELPCAP